MLPPGLTGSTSVEKWSNKRLQTFSLTTRTGSVASEVCRVVGVSTQLSRDSVDERGACWITPAKKSFVSGGKWSNRYLGVVTVGIDNNSTKRLHARIAHTRARAVARSAMAIGAKAAISRGGERVNVTRPEISVKRDPSEN